MGKNSFLLKHGDCYHSRGQLVRKQHSLHGKADRLVALAAMTWGILVTAVLAVPVRCLAVEIVDRVVAVVNNDVVSLYELNQSVQPFVEQIKSSQYTDDVRRRLMFEVRQKVLQQLIDQKLTDQELARLKITVSESEVDNSIERIKEEKFLTDETLRTALEQQGLTYEKYREQLKKQLLRMKLVNLEIRSKIVITEEEIKSYYEKHSDNYRGERKYLLQNLYIRLPALASYQDKQTASAMMESIHQELESGKPFDALAEEYAGTKAMIETSDLGYFKLDDLSDQLRQAVGALQAGTHTPVLESDFGFQIVYVKAIEEVGGRTIEEAAPEIQQKLYNEVVDQKYESWLQLLRARSHIKIIN